MVFLNLGQNSFTYQGSPWDGEENQSALEKKTKNLFTPRCARMGYSNLDKEYVFFTMLHVCIYNMKNKSKTAKFS